MFAIDRRNRVDNVRNFKRVREIKAKSFKEAETILLQSVPGLTRHWPKPKPGKRIDSVTFSSGDFIYSLKKIG